MHMTLEADYAVRIVEFLAEQVCKTDAHTIAEQTRVPLRFALKILRTLVSQDIIVSYKGAKEGYQLAHPAEEITLRQVIEAVEGPYVLNRCQHDEYTCGHTACRFHHVYNEISQLVREKLESVNFSAGAEQKKETSSRICFWEENGCGLKAGGRLLGFQHGRAISSAGFPRAF